MAAIVSILLEPLLLCFLLLLPWNQYWQFIVSFLLTNTITKITSWPEPLLLGVLGLQGRLHCGRRRNLQKMSSWWLNIKHYVTPLIAIWGNPLYWYQLTTQKENNITELQNKHQFPANYCIVFPMIHHLVKQVMWPMSSKTHASNFRYQY